MGVDGISLPFIFLSVVMSVLCVGASWTAVTARRREFYATLLVAETAMIGLFSATNFFLFYVFWELMVVPMFLLVGVWGGSGRVRAAVKFLLFTLGGSLLMLVGLIAMLQATGTLDFRAFGATRLSLEFQVWLFVAFTAAFAVKVPMFPVHTWLPDAHTEAPTAGSVILAGILLKLGGYGFIRFSIPLYPEASINLAPIVIGLSLVAIIYGAIVALRQTDLKRLVAYSSVSHMGFVTLGVFVSILIPVGAAGREQGMQGAILQMVNHGLITGALFLLVGVIYERTHDRAIARMGGLAGPVPVYAAVFGFFVFASAGLPGLSGFVGEFLVLVGSFAYQPLVAAIATLCMILAAGYLLWMFQRVTFGELSDLLRGLGHHLVDMRPVEILTLAPLAALVVIFGLFPGLLLGLFDTTVGEVLAAVGQAADLVARR
jgi:NADH-quinone oxidoreductase subunit M